MKRKKPSQKPSGPRSYDPEDDLIAELEKKLGGKKKVRDSFAKDGLDWVLDLDNGILAEDSDQEVEEISSTGAYGKKRSVKPDSVPKRQKLLQVERSPSQSSESSPDEEDSDDLSSEADQSDPAAPGEGEEDSEDAVSEEADSEDDSAEADEEEADEEGADEEEDSEEGGPSSAEPAEERRRRAQPGPQAVPADEEEREAQRQALLASGRGLPPDVTRAIRGQLNRLAESNVAAIAAELHKLYAKHSRHGLSEQICTTVLNQCDTPNSVVKLLAVNAALIILLTDLVGLEVTGSLSSLIDIGYCLDQFAPRFQKVYESKNTAVAANFLKFLADLYLLKGIEAVLIFDLLKVFIASFEEADVDLIMALVSTCGPQLRKDDPASLVEVIKAVKAAAEKKPAGETSVRFKFMLDQIYELKNNKREKGPSGGALDYLSGVLSAQIKTKSSSRLSIGWADLTGSEKKGRWWLIGSAWAHAGNSAFRTTDATAPQDSASEELLVLARKHHMNTDIRKAVFCILLSADDHLDAFEKLFKLGLKDKQEREIIHVLLHCCLSERTYNPYYAQIATKFCAQARPFQVTAQFALWDKFKELPKGTLKAHEILDLANFLCDLLISGALPLQVLKALDFSLTSAQTFAFLRLLIVRLLTEPQLSVVVAMFEKLALSGEKNMKVREDLLQFFLQGLSNTKYAQKSPKHKQLLRDRIMRAKEILEKASFSVF